MLRSNTRRTLNCNGFSLIEMLVGLAIGLITTLVITQAIIAYEGQKRGTSGSSEAQTSGSIALYMMQRGVQMAGYGLPIYSSNSPLNCSNSNQTFDHDADTSTAEMGISPVFIVDGGTGAGASDTLTIRFGTEQMGGFPVKVLDASTLNLGVDNSLGCQGPDAATGRPGDVAVMVDGTTCSLGQVAAIPDTTHITLKAAAGAVSGAKIACMGNWQETVYRINNGALEENGTAIMANIVNMQVQYGISTSASNNIINQWVDATAGGEWEAPTVTNRNRIKALRIAIVARNGLLEKEDVVNVPCKTGRCVWAGNDPAEAGKNSSIDLTSDGNWKHYRYRVFETMVPIRNVIWSSGGLQ